VRVSINNSLPYMIRAPDEKDFNRLQGALTVKHCPDGQCFTAGDLRTIFVSSFALFARRSACTV
jgi:hypothetical protein